MAKKSSAQGDRSVVRPLGDRVLIKPLATDEMHTTSPSGIIIPDSAHEDKKDRGTVIAVGAGRRGDDGALVPMAVAVGDTVIFQWGEKIEYNGQDYYLVSEGNILAILE